MSIGDVFFLGAVVMMFALFMAGLGWGSWQTRNLPVPRILPAKDSAARR